MRLHDLLDFRARESPDGGFAVQGARRVTYGEALSEATRLANGFVAAGLERGDRVAVLGKNSIDYAVLYFAASKAGVVPVPLNYRLAPPEWAYIVNDARARVLIASADFRNGADTVRGEMKSVERFIALDDGVGTPNEGVGTPRDRAAGWKSYRAWVSAQSAIPPERDVSDDDVLYQMYTSGTTGRPKGALLTHRAISANLAQVMLSIPPVFGEPWLIVVPMYHAAGAVTTFVCVQAGGCLHIHRDFNPAEVVRALSEDGIARTSLVPAMIQACLVAVPDVASRRYPHLRLIAYGASPIAESTLRRAIEVFGCEFIQSYGMTETTAVLTQLLPSDHARALAGKPDLLLSAGRPLAGTEIRIVDDDDRPVPHGTVGQIVARGPQMMQGYFNMPEESHETLRGGWMHTGDAGTVDDDGYVYILDRTKDMIVSGGENIYPRAIEDVLFEHPAIADAAVIGVPDEKWGETVKAVVVLRAGARASEEDIIDFCRGKLGGFERPRSVDFVDAMPRNASGKVLKRVLREPYWKDQRRRVAGS